MTIFQTINRKDAEAQIARLGKPHMEQCPSTGEAFFVTTTDRFADAPDWGFGIPERN